MTKRLAPPDPPRPPRLERPEDAVVSLHCTNPQVNDNSATATTASTLLHQQEVLMSKTKNVIVVKAGSGKNTEVEVRPGETTKDLLEKLGFEGYLQKLDEGSPFGATEELYPRVANGEKLIVAPHAPVQLA